MAVKNDKTGYVVEPRNSEKLAESIVSYFKENKYEELIAGIRSEADKYSWMRMAEIIENMVDDNRE